MSDERTSAIYALYDARDNVPRYIGRTMQPLKLRRQTHVSEGRHAHLPCHRDLWIREVEATGGTIAIREIDRVPASQAPERERAWIERLKAEGMPLVNSMHCQASMHHERSLKATRISYPGIGTEFRSMRNRIGLSQSALGEYLGVCRSTIQAYEREAMSVPRDTWEKLHTMWVDKL